MQIACGDENFPEKIVISDKGKIITEKYTAQHMGKSEYYIKMIILVNDEFTFREEMKNFLHTKNVYTVSLVRQITMMECFDAFPIMLFGQVFAIDYYGDDLNGLACPLVKHIEEINRSLEGAYRIFAGYDYGEEREVDFPF